MRGAPDAGEEVDESRRYHKGLTRVPKEWCAVCGLCDREGLHMGLQKDLDPASGDVTVCELYGLPPTVIGCGDPYAS